MVFSKWRKFDQFISLHVKSTLDKRTSSNEGYQLNNLPTEGSLVFLQINLNNSLMVSCKFCQKKKKPPYIILNWSLFNNLYTARETTLYTLLYAKLLRNSMYFCLTLNAEKKSASTP